jgi:putative oxidoreductase
LNSVQKCAGSALTRYLGAAMSERRDLGLLILRVGIGGMFVFHGLPKLLGGPARWSALGGAMKAFGIDFGATFWGLMAAIAETGGGLCLALGVAFRPALVLLTTTMVVATAHHLHKGDGFARASHAIEAAILFISLLFIGAGKYRLRR